MREEVARLVAEKREAEKQARKFKEMWEAELQHKDALVRDLKEARLGAKDREAECNSKEEELRVSSRALEAAQKELLTLRDRGSQEKYSYLQLQK